MTDGKPKDLTSWPFLNRQVSQLKNTLENKLCLFPLFLIRKLDLYRKYHVESSWIKYILGAFTFIKAVFHGFIPGKMEGDKAIVPADFLINEDGTIHTAYYGNNIGDHIPIELINEFIHNY